MSRTRKFDNGVKHTLRETTGMRPVGRRRASQVPVSYCHTRTVQSWLADASLPATQGRGGSRSRGREIAAERHPGRRVDQGWALGSSLRTAREDREGVDGGEVAVELRQARPGLDAPDGDRVVGGPCAAPQRL